MTKKNRQYISPEQHCGMDTQGIIAIVSLLVAPPWTAISVQMYCSVQGKGEGGKSYQPPNVQYTYRPTQVDSMHIYLAKRCSTSQLRSPSAHS